jgi:hypothetical protein
LALDGVSLVELVRLSSPGKKVAQAMVLSIEPVPDDVNGGTDWTQ